MTYQLNSSNRSVCAMRYRQDLSATWSVPSIRSIRLGAAGGQAWIDAQVGEAEVVFVDNISTLVRSGKENEAEGWLPVQSWVLRHRRAGRAVVLLHHAGKGGAQRGTSRRVTGN
jgi:hypothetical protein